MFFAQIVIKDDYEEKGDLVFPRLIREFKENGLDALMKHGEGFLMGIVTKNGVFHEWFTGAEISFPKYENLDYGDVYQILLSLGKEKTSIAKDVIENILFNREKINDIAYEDVNSGLAIYPNEQNNIIDRSSDRMKEQIAFERGLSPINPYDDPEYNNFLHKCNIIGEMIRKMEDEKTK